jgi:hypothetical protein
MGTFRNKHCLNIKVIMMKTWIIFISLLMLLVTSCIKDIICIKGNGDFQTQSRSTNNFNEIVNTTSIDVIYRKADTISINIYAESNYFDNISTRTTNGRLELRTEPRNACFDHKRRPYIVVTSPAVDVLELTGSGDFAADSLSGNNVEMKLTGSGDLETEYISSSNMKITITGSGDAEFSNVAFDEADFTLTGSGDLSISGTGTSLIARVTGSGNVEAGELPVISADLTITGSGNIFTQVSDQLKAVISGSGNIYLKGNPVIDQTITGSGRIINR